MTSAAANAAGPLKLAAAFAVVFGAMTLISGGTALFSGEETRNLFGHAVPFVLWFNFLSGLAYVLAGVGLWGKKTWAVYLSILIFMAIAGIIALFALHVFSGGAYEMRTVVALSFRCVCWLTISLIAFRFIKSEG